MSIDFSRERQRMVAEQLERRGVRDRRILEAMGEVPREAFVPPGYRDAAYADQPLPIGDGQTISQPYVVARMIELAEVTERDVVLDVGCGSGYQTAVLSRLAARVYGLEVREELAERARESLAGLGVENVEVVVGDGGYGLPAHAPYDAILVAAAAERPPRPLLEQLTDGGRMVLPLGTRFMQYLSKITRRGDQCEREAHGGVRFVSFVGDFGDHIGEDSLP